VYPVTYAAFVPPGSTSSTLGGTSTNKTTQEVRLASASNGKLEWIIGAFYQNEKSGTDQNFKIFKPDGSLADGLYGTIYQNNYSTSLKEYAGFGNVTWYIVPEFDLTAGYRYSKNDQVITRNRKGLIGNPATPLVFRSRTQDSSDSVNTYLFTARWRITPDAMLYARAASGYRPGGPRDVAPGTVAPAGFAFSFDPDTVWNYEAGLRTTWLNKKLTTDISAYQINWKNIQALTPDSGFQVFNNAGNAKVKGLEFSGRLVPLERLTLNLTASLTDTRLTSLATTAGPALGAAVGDPLNNIPKWMVGVSGDYDFPLYGDWVGFLGASYRYRSHVWTAFSLSTTRQNLPSYDEVDLRAGATFNNVTVQAYVKNVGDTRGYTTATAPLAAGLPYAVAVTRPRTVGLFTKVTF
jgi:outer membrane receptor protein involved in Fe transport